MLTAAELVWLLAAVAKGDEAAFERLFAATRAKIYGIVLRILRRQDLADQVMQDVYLKIWTAAARYDPATSAPITWMVAIARNEAIDLVRMGGAAAAEEQSEFPAVGARSPDPQARREMTGELKRLLGCIGRLGPDQQRLVLLAYFNGLSRPQLADKLGVPVDTIRIWLRSSLAEIRGCLGS